MNSALSAAVPKSKRRAVCRLRRGVSRRGGRRCNSLGRHHPFLVRARCHVREVQYDHPARTSGASSKSSPEAVQGPPIPSSSTKPTASLTSGPLREGAGLRDRTTVEFWCRAHRKSRGHAFAAIIQISNACADFAARAAGCLLPVTKQGLWRDWAAARIRHASARVTTCQSARWVGRWVGTRNCS
jgi:hypothetical protein